MTPRNLTAGLLLAAAIAGAAHAKRIADPERYEAQAKEAQGDFRGAAEQVTQLVARSPRHFEHREWLIELLVLAGEHRSALAQADDFAEITKNSWEARWLSLRTGLLCGEDARAAAAAVELERLIATGAVLVAETDGMRVEIWIARALNGDAEAATRDLAAALKDVPAAGIERAVARYLAGLTDEAELRRACPEDAIVNEPARALVKLAIGARRRASGDLAGAREALKVGAAQPLAPAMRFLVLAARRLLEESRVE